MDGVAQTGAWGAADAINGVCEPQEHQTLMRLQNLLAFNPSDLVWANSGVQSKLN